ncbi:MAG TPA: CinA family protein [Dehalococcoidia bacterium]|nr:CinA family protein [Dehalococcoidia bacterium]
MTTDTGMASRVLSMLREEGLTLAVAEASTGGLIGHLLTEVPGSSATFVGGVVPYHNRLKERVGVDRATLERHGAVSEEAAAALARAVRRWAEADLGLAVSGIAGPGGGTAEKPVGLTYIALAGPDCCLCRRFLLAGDRSANKRQAALAALELVAHYLHYHHRQEGRPET